MSSPRSERRRLRPWRRVMIAGALVLLAGALAGATAYDIPRAVPVALNAAGVVLLAVGFGMAVRG